MPNPKRPRKPAEPDFSQLAHHQIKMLTDPPGIAPRHPPASWPNWAGAEGRVAGRREPLA